MVWAASLASAEQIKTWVDETGQLHFSDTVPYNVEAEAAAIRPAAPGERTGLRPGERAMLERYEQRGRRVGQARQRPLRDSKPQRGSSEKQRARRAKCKYYRHRLHAFRAKRRRGYTRGAEDKIAADIQRYEMQTEIYCD